jgi:hypothetical protein
VHPSYISEHGAICEILETFKITAICNEKVMDEPTLENLFLVAQKF